MIEIRYITKTGRVTAWCKDETSFGKLREVEGEAIVITGTSLVEYSDIGEFYFDSKTKTISFSPTPFKTPRNLAAEIDDLKAKLIAKGIIT